MRSLGRSGRIDFATIGQSEMIRYPGNGEVPFEIMVRRIHIGIFKPSRLVEALRDGLAIVAISRIAVFRIVMDRDVFRRPGYLIGFPIPGSTSGWAPLP